MGSFRTAALGFGMLALSGCRDELPLELEVPDGELYGVVQLTARGSYEQLQIHVEDELLASGPGPMLTAEWNTALEDEGSYQLKAVGVDKNGEKTEAVQTVTVVEPPEPIVAILSPLNGSVYDAGPIPVEFTVSSQDDLATVSLVASADGKDEVLKRFAPGDAYTFDWSPAAGEHQLTAEAETVFGESGRDSVKVTLAEEICEITKPKDGGNLPTTQEVAVAVSFLGGESAQKVTLLLDGVEAGTDLQSPWSVVVDASDKVGSLVELQAVCEGSLGTVLQSDTIQLTVVEPTAFGVEITRPKEGDVVSGTVTVKAAIGGGAGVQNGELYVNDLLVESLAKSPWEFTWDTTTVENGPATVKVVGYEKDSGAEASASVQVTVEN